MDCGAQEAPSNLSYFSMITSLVLSAITIPGNFLVLLAVHKDPHKELRKPFTIFVANLALADFTAGSVTEPTASYYTIQEARGGVVEGFAVYITHLSYFMSCTTSVLTLGVLAIDRYLVISHSLWYKAHVTMESAAKVCIFVWIVSITLSMVYIKTGFISFAFVFANTAVLTTSCVLVFSYYSIFKTLRSRTVRVGVLHEGVNQCSEGHVKSLMLENKLIKLYMMMLGIFLFCFVPSCAFIYVLYFCSVCDCITIHWLRDMSFLLVLVSSSLNPLLYSLRMKAFRKAFKSMLSFQRKSVKVGIHLDEPALSLENPDKVKDVSITVTVSRETSGDISPLQNP